MQERQVCELIIVKNKKNGFQTEKQWITTTL